MRISRAWLSDYVDLDDVSLDAYADLITTKVAEVDDVEVVGGGVLHAAVVRVTGVEAHPEKANLKIATITDGTDNWKVVCGAPNLRSGILAAYFAPGTRAVTNFESQDFREVETAQISGVQSPGFLASERELGITSSEDGILILEQDAPLGAKLHSVVGEPDVVIVIDNKSLTHRPDLWSHFGFARELSAILRRPLKRDIDELADIDARARIDRLLKGNEGYQVEIAAGTQCPRYACINISGLGKNRRSPLALRRRLQAIHAGTRNLLVDLSNYVLADVGQPNHTFDRSKLQGNKITVRCAKDGEMFLGLDDIERRLSIEDVVIADAQGPVALGGVIGGKESAISEETTEVLLESANFDPVRIRQTTKRHGVRTDASNRFEKSQSPYLVPIGIHRYLELLDAHGETPTTSRMSDTFPVRPPAVSVPFRYGDIRKRLGVEISDSDIQEILESLRFRIEPAGGKQSDELICHVPYHRATRDISHAADLVEEVGRIFGYDDIPEEAPQIVSEPVTRDLLKGLENELRDALCANGFHEAYLYSFQESQLATKVGFPLKNAVHLENPIDAELETLRTSLIPGMLRALEANYRFRKEIALFELGRTYSQEGIPQHEDPRQRVASLERRQLCIAYAPGDLSPALAPRLKDGQAFFATLAMVRDLLGGRIRTRLNAFPTMRAAENHQGFGHLRPWMHPHRQASLDVDGVVVGVIAEVSPGIGLDLPPECVICELDVGMLLKLQSQDFVFEPLHRQPDSYFEMSIVMPKRDHFQRLEELLLAELKDSPYLKSLRLLDVYEGAPLAEGEKSISVQFTFNGGDRTLSAEEIKEIETGLIERVRSSSYTLRSA